MSALLTPERAIEVLSGILSQDIKCEQRGSGLRLDTPYILQDGHALRVTLRPGERNGDVIASDAGFATSLIEEHFDSRAAQDVRFAELRRIAGELGIEWNVEFSVREGSLERAMERLIDIAQAVDRTLSLVRPRIERHRSSTVSDLGRRLEEVGLRVISPSRIHLRGGPAVQVDHEIKTERSGAAIEVLGGETMQGAFQAIGSAVTDFWILERHGYEGRLFAVYDENSKMQLLRLRQRFNAAVPSRVLLLRSQEAVDKIRHLLAS